MNNRDLTGFVDGNENTEGEQRKKIAPVGNEDPDLKNRLIFKFNSLRLQFRKVEKRGSENAKVCIMVALNTPTKNLLPLKNLLRRTLNAPH
tara:strand:+ start:196 stop:468 length:273 start_codon:yes stop_codon:yes gene_type:complete